MIIKHYMIKSPNVGDGIIDLATKKILYSVFPNSKIFSFRSHLPVYYNQLIRLGKNDQMAGIRKASLNLFKKPDLIVIGGAPTWATSSLAYLNTDDILENNSPVVFLGSGTQYYRDGGETKRKEFMNNINKIKKLIPITSARDEPTCNDMKNQGLNAYMTGCPVMHYVGNEIRYKDSDYFIISFRQSEYLEKIKISREFIKELEKILQAKCLIVFHDYREVAIVEELSGKKSIKHKSFLTRGISKIVRKLNAQVKITQDVNYIVDYNPENLIEFFSNAKFVLAYRLHGALMASTCGTPFLQIGNDGRCSDFIKTFDPEKKYNISSENITPNDILDRIQTIMRNKDKYNYKDYGERVARACENLNNYKNELKKIIH